MDPSVRATTRTHTSNTRQFEPQLKRCHFELELKECHVFSLYPEPQLKEYRSKSQLKEHSSKTIFKVSPMHCRPCTSKANNISIISLSPDTTKIVKYDNYLWYKMALMTAIFYACGGSGYRHIFCRHRV